MVGLGDVVSSREMQFSPSTSWLSKWSKLYICVEYTTTGEFQISEVDRWTRTPISADIGTFAFTLSTYVLIETHIKGVHTNSSRESSDKDACIRICYILKAIIVEEILVPQKHQNWYNIII